ncbi:hemagglutinin-related protein [Escherichia coli]|nr:VENN motif pre-toxin domain-containing protein [Escherichia coli]OMI44305.1 hypothetical protein MP33_10920 [Escherichia coli N37058PS]EEW3745979.1 hypothetical protein [Escherichia coli]EEW5208360.1 hypothetical protein [Escherichia coli]EEW8751677.1 hypothetical protein [Escherichia coli]EFO0585017.1 hypothetical protein [Escherichia coli]
MQGNNVAAGAAGAATGELAARAIAGMMYPGVKQSDLSEEQKQTISTLATVSAGLAGGNLSAALAGGAAPYIAEIIKQTTPEGAGRVAAHAVVNAALSLAQGKNALAGAAGAATGEVVGMIATQM